MFAAYRVGVTPNEDASLSKAWSFLNYTDFDKALNRYQLYLKDLEGDHDTGYHHIILFKDVVDFDTIDGETGLPAVKTYVIKYKHFDNSKIVQYNKQEIVAPAPEEPPTTMPTDFSFTAEMYETLTQ